MSILATACSGEEGCDCEGAPPPTAVAAQIENMLRASAQAWNAGDLDGFLDDYLDSPTSSFAGANGVIRGTGEIRARYERSYWAAGRARESLRFEGLDVRSLGPAHALAIGRYVLYDPVQDSTTNRGYFSLVLERTDAGWKIIHDHTSAAIVDTRTPRRDQDGAAR